MAEVTPPEVTPPAPAPSPRAKFWSRIAYGVAGVAALVVGGVQLLSLFVLPACDASNIRDTVHSIFASKDVTLTVLDDIARLSDADGRVLCSAHIETADEIGTIEYSITWSGWSAQVKIEKVDAAPRGPSG